MGSRALYEITENGITTSYYSHWGANILTPAWRLMQAEEFAQQEQHSNMTISEIMKHVGHAGTYISDSENTEDRPILEEVNKPSADRMRDDLCNGYDIEALIRLNLDNNRFEYHENPRMSYTNRQTRTITGRLDSLKSYAKHIIDSEPDNVSFDTVEQKLMAMIVNEPRSLRNFESYKNKECYERFTYVSGTNQVEMRKMVYTPDSRDTFANIISCKLNISDLISFSEGDNHTYTEFERKCIYNGTERYITNCRTGSELSSEFCRSPADFSRLSNLDPEQKELCDYINRTFRGDRCAKKLIDTLTPEIRAIDSMNGSNNMEIKLSEYTTVSACPFPIPHYNNYWGFYYHNDRAIGIIISKTSQYDIESAARNRLALDISQEKGKIYKHNYGEQQEIRDNLPEYIAEAINQFVADRQYDEQNSSKKVATTKYDGTELSFEESTVKADSYASDISAAAQLLNTGNGVKLGQLSLGDDMSDTLALVNLADAGKQNKAILFISKGDDIGLKPEQIGRISGVMDSLYNSPTQNHSENRQRTAEQQTSRRR